MYNYFILIYRYNKYNCEYSQANTYKFRIYNKMYIL